MTRGFARTMAGIIELMEADNSGVELAEITEAIAAARKKETEYKSLL